MNGFTTAFNWVENSSEEVLIIVITSAIAAGLVAALVLAINLFVRRWLTSKQMGLLWGLVLIRLAMPFAPESTMSLQNFFVSSVQEAPRHMERRDAYAAASTPNQELLDWPEWQITKSVETAAPTIGVVEYLFTSFISILELFISLQYLPMIWVCGSVAIFNRMLIIHWWFARKVQQSPISQDERLLRLWKSCCEQAGVRRKLPVILFDGVSQPSIMGAFRPRLLLPTDIIELNDEQLKLIMLHELAHVRRWDVAINWGLFANRILHWWNPIYWLAVTRYCSLREQTCDAMVLHWMSSSPEENTNRDYCREYSELLLTLAQRPHFSSRWKVSLPVSILGLFSASYQKRSVSNRLHALHRATIKRHAAVTSVVVTTIVVIAACGLTNATQPSAEHDIDDVFSTNIGSFTFPCQPSYDQNEPFKVIVYSMDEALHGIAKQEGITDEDARKLLVAQVNFFFECIQPPVPLEMHQENPEHLIPEQLKPAANWKDLRLVVNGPESVHKEFGIQVDAWQKSGLSQITIEARFIVVSKNIADSLGIKWDKREENTVRPSGSEHEKSTPKQAFEYIQAAQGDERSNIWFAPKVTLFNGQKATISDSVQRPFVVGVSRNESGKLEPEIKIFEDGVKLTCRATLAADSSIIHFSGNYDSSSIDDVQTFSSTVQGKKASIQVPSVTTHRLHFSEELKDSQTFLIECCSDHKQKECVYLMIAPHVIKDPD